MGVDRGKRLYLWRKAVAFMLRTGKIPMRLKAHYYSVRRLSELRESYRQRVLQCPSKSPPGTLLTPSSAPEL